MSCTQETLEDFITATGRELLRQMMSIPSQRRESLGCEGMDRAALPIAPTRSAGPVGRMPLAVMTRSAAVCRGTVKPIRASRNTSSYARAATGVEVAAVTQYDGDELAGGGRDAGSHQRGEDVHSFHAGSV
ncbi:hypothetical protein [Streptomyces sp. Ag109_O5-1]|uniref:hypothetical protein n=1 Tax=Streptomyces sp. Ag109_O5-1 TaxID=1938851 RepID=UPI000F4F76C7|nr:hypothetical protein [Streptomyces sp. Ag109_O5-1]